jgi:Uncharacterized protein conserved in bacteria
MQSFSRRNFLKGVAATTCGSCVHAISPLSKGGYIAWGAPEPAQSAGALGDRPLLILVNLDGGCSYNITPIYTGAYRDRNRDISYGPENSIPLNGAVDQGLHPSLTGLKPIWDEKNLAVMNLVGLNDPTGVTRSHDDGGNVKLMGITNVAEVKSGATPGWVVRMSAHFGEPFSGITINSSKSGLMGGSNPPLSITTLDTLGESMFIRQEVGDWTKWTRSAIMNSGNAAESPNQAVIRNTMTNVDNAFAELGRQIAPVTLPVQFDLTRDASGFVRACRDAATLAITTSLKVRFIYLEHRGFDTHGLEKQPLIDLLNTLNNGLTPLIQTLKASGIWNNTVIATLSEFCRTHQNGTRGSDHGASGPMLVMGGRVKGRQINPVPTVTQINRGDFFTDTAIDFRSPFYEIIAAIGLNPDEIMPYRIVPQPLGLF